MFATIKRASFACAAVLTGFASLVSAEVKLQGAGATFPNPLYQRWVTEYQKINPEIKIDYQSIGSGGGIKAITEKTVDFAGSDAALSTKEKEALENKAIHIPTCAGAVVLAYNLSGVGELHLTGETIADIYLGKITKWNDAKIAALNSGATLPDLTITPVFRTDGSGTTAVFTSYVAGQSDPFKETIGMGKQVKFGAGTGGKGNDGVAAVIKTTAGSIGYIELNYATANHIDFASIQNKNGKMIKPSIASVSAAGAGAVESMTPEKLNANIWNQPGDEAYPISSFTYIIVNKDLSNIKDAEKAKALVGFLHWTLSAEGGQKFAPELDYAPLAPGVITKAQAAINSLNYNGNPIK